jgi:hypothetical protein
VITIKKQVRYKIERRGELQKDAEGAAEKVGAATKVLFKKLDDSYTDLKAGYQKERRKQKMA